MDYLKLIREKDLQQLVINRQAQRPVQGTAKEIKFKPVVKLHIPHTYCLWLLSELDEDGIAFGLCQIHCAELGSVWLDELLDLDIDGLKVVQDTTFQPTMTIGDYAKMANRNSGLLLL